MQNFQERTCSGVSFRINCSQEACNFIKKQTPAQVFSRDFCEISKNTYFVEHLRTVASKITGELVYLIKTFSVTIHAGLFTSFFRCVFIPDTF